MSFLLSSENVVEYLHKQGIARKKVDSSVHIESKISKNFNLLVSFAADSNNHQVAFNNHFLVKQELSGYGEYGQIFNSIAGEWRINRLLEQYNSLNHLRDQFSQAICFDRENAIIVMNYFSEYGELKEFYDRSGTFPVEIATQIGTSLAEIHCATLNHQEYREFLVEEFPHIDRPPHYFARGLEVIKPGIFGKVTQENLQFFKLYQRYPNLRRSVIELRTAFQNTCLIHNDLKLDNILLHSQWEQKLSKNGTNSIVRIIDWELFTWGDPAYDLGKLLSSYLNIWLDSFLVSADIDWQISLQLATTPLNLLQPSMRAIFQAYCDRFPEILQLRPDFLKRVVQFTGIALIKRVHKGIDEHLPLTNRSICLLQVAKNLICEPEKSIPTIFAASASQLVPLDRISA